MVTVKKRVVAFFLAFTAVLMSFTSFPGAKAVSVVDDLAVAMTAFSVASGYAYHVSGLTGEDLGDWLVNDALPAYLYSIGVQSKQEWWGNTKVESYPLTGKVVFGKMATQLLSDFFSWLTGEYDVIPGGDSVPVYIFDTLTIGGQEIKPLITEFPYPEFTSFRLGKDFHYSSITTFPINTDIDLGGLTIRIDQWGSADFKFFINGTLHLTYVVGMGSSEQKVCFIRYGEYFTFGLIYKTKLSDGTIEYCADFLSKKTTDTYLLGIPVTSSQGDLSISAADTLTIPDASTMTEDAVYTIATNVVADTQEEYYQKILDAITANDFSATVATDVPDVPDIPVEDDTTSILGVLSNIWEGIKSIPERLASLGNTIVSGIVSGVIGFLDTIIGILRGIWEAILDFPALLQGIWDTILDFPAVLQNIWEAVLDIPTAISQAVTGVVTGVKDAVVAFFTPSEELKVEGLSSVFPFCIPSDLVALIQALNHKSEAPVFTVPLHFAFVNYEGELVIDLTEWEPAAAAVRWGVTILFIGGLILLTRNLIKG